MDISRHFKSLIDASGYLILIEFSKIIRLVESNEFFRCGVDISGNLRLINLSRFLKFQFRVRAVSYRIFLLIIGGSK